MEGKTTGPPNWTVPDREHDPADLRLRARRRRRSRDHGRLRDPRPVAARTSPGSYLFADFFRGEVRTLRYSHPIPGDTPRGPAITNLSSFGEDAAGHLYATTSAAAVSGASCRARPRDAHHPAGRLGASTQPDLRHRAAAATCRGCSSSSAGHDPAGQGRRADRRRRSWTSATSCSPSGEQGLLSMAFAPDYATSKRFYVYYTDSAGNNRIEEFQRYTADRASRASRRRRAADRAPGRRRTTTAASCSSARTATCTPPPATAAAAFDPRTTAQNLGSLHGKILRIDPRPPG